MTTRNTMKTGSGVLAGLALFALTFVALPGSANAGGGVTDANVAEKSVSASTAADHQALAAYFRDKAAEESKKVAMHEDMLARMKGHGKPAKNFIPHCNSLIHSARQSQEAYENLAKLHLEIAKEVRD